MNRARFAFVTLSAAVLAACASQAPPVPRVAQQYQIAQPVAFAKNPDTQVYTLGDGGPNAQNVNGLQVGADGAFYFTVAATPTATPWPTAGEIGRFNPVARTQTFAAVPYMPGAIDETASGAVFVQEFNNTSGTPTVDRYSGIGGTDKQITVAFGPPDFQAPWNGMSSNFVVGADGLLWFASSLSPDLAEIHQSTNTATVFPLKTPSGGFPPNPQFVVLGTDHYIYTTDATNNGVIRVASTGSSKGANTFTALPGGFDNFVYSPQGITEGSDGRLYVSELAAGAQNYSGSQLDSAVPAKSLSFTSVGLPAGAVPYLFAPDANGVVYFSDYRYYGLGVYNTSTGSMVDLPLPAPIDGGIVIDSKGVPWSACISALVLPRQACVERVALTSTWEVFPAATLTLYTQDEYGNPLPPGLLGIGETGNSGPFTVSSSNTHVCTAQVVSGFDHNIAVNPLKAGTCTLSITDAHARTVKTYVTVVSGKGIPQMHVRPGRLR
ncbi:MAG TPA: hypothetical protein VGZ02_16495 [Candidatus Baltobacteraceae bacterium]|jgi:streptogramin lyase|nr:hypothetical protein [Candidatus Baltobacteraceae bacterium]